MTQILNRTIFPFSNIKYCIVSVCVFFIKRRWY